jgi:hypothetical protein
MVDILKTNEKQNMISKKLQKELADLAGLVYSGENEDGELEFIGTEDKWKKFEALKEGVCKFCEGTGEVSVDESDGEGHIMKGTGTQKCICTLQDNLE